MAPIIIIGSGLAGYNTARMFRRLDPETPLLIVTTDGGEFYPKPMLSEAFAAGKTPEAIVNSTAEQMAAQVKAIVRPHTLVTAIERGSACRVGSWVPAGARRRGPGRSATAGDAAERVQSVNSLTSARLRARSRGRRRWPSSAPS
jgi:rubredoxin-NAD+ reductase